MLWRGAAPAKDTACAGPRHEAYESVRQRLVASKHKRTAGPHPARDSCQDRALHVWSIVGGDDVDFRTVFLTSTGVQERSSDHDGDECDGYSDDQGKPRCPDPSSRLLSVGELARRSGVAVSALHFYEARGLIRSTRTVGNQRCYARDALRRVGVIKAAQRVGIPLESIRDALPSICCSSTGCMSGGRRRALPPRGEGADER